MVNIFHISILLLVFSNFITCNRMSHKNVEYHELKFKEYVVVENSLSRILEKNYKEFMTVKM